MSAAKQTKHETLIVDCDSHFLPRDAFESVEGRLADKRPRIKFNENGMLECVEFPGVPAQVPGSAPTKASGLGSGSKMRGLWDMELRLAEYEKMGIGAQVILPQFGGWWNLLIDTELAIALAHSYNLSMLRTMRKYPGVYPVATVAAQDPESAVKELEWAAENGFRGGLVLDHTFPVRDHPFGEPTPSRRQLWPLFKRAAELKMPVHFHPVQHGHRLRNLTTLQRDGVGEFFLPPMIDHQMCVVACITSGLLDQYPDLRIVQSEMLTGFIPELMHRMDKVYEEFQELASGKAVDVAVEARKRGNSGNYVMLSPEEAAIKNKRPPSYYFRNNLYWTIETEEHGFAAAVECIGAERFLFATDYPHDDPGGAMKYEDVGLLAGNAQLSEQEKERIRGANAVELFRLAA